MTYIAIRGKPRISLTVHEDGRITFSDYTLLQDGTLWKDGVKVEPYEVDWGLEVFFYANEENGWKVIGHGFVVGYTPD